MGVSNAQKLLDVENEYKNKLKNEKIEKLEVQSKMRKQRTTATILVISLLALSGLLVVFWQRLRMKANRVIAKQKEELHKEQTARQQLKQEKLESELEQSKRQLVSKALQIAKNNELLKGIEMELKSSDETNKTTTNRVLRTIKNSTQQEKDWAQFLEIFESVHPHFIKEVKLKSDALTTNDIRLCSLEKMNFDTKQIASILHVSSDGVKKARYRLKKKLGIVGEASISSFVQSIA
jgi:hypothetical protein